jgi:hypothetical protein
MTPTATLDQQQQAALVGPNQKYWDLGLQCFKDGDLATTAIKKIWKAMLPPASLSVLASIVGALYGDTYWDTIKMSADHLAQDITASIGIKHEDALKAANIAFSNWYGLLVRSNFGDKGGIPRRDFTQSPDVVVNGKSSLTVDELITMWNVYDWDPQPGLKNYTYGRAQSVNIQVPIEQAKLRMFYSDGGFVPPPQSWIQQFTFDNQAESRLEGMLPGAVQIGGKVANPDPFSFTPPGSGHYCLISVVSTEFFTNDPLNTPGNWNSSQWIANNGAAGWHNVDVPKSKESTLKFYNQDNSEERFVFEAHASRVPEGTRISLGFADKQLAQTYPTKTITIDKPYQVLTTEAQIPPNFTGDLIVGIDGKPLPADASVDVRLNWSVAPAHARFIDAVESLGAVRALNLKTPVGVSLGNFTFIGK